MKAEIYGRWWASVPMRERAMSQSYMENQSAIQKKWDKEWGDRMNELVLIGQEMDEAQIRLDLDACTLTDSEIEGFKAGEKFIDMWPI